MATRMILAFTSVVALMLMVPAVHAATPVREIPLAYQLAADRAEVPASILFALALQESATRRNGRLIPWPWTLNIAGAPARFATRREACVALLRALREGAAPVDVGLGQISVQHHRHRVRTPCALLDPYRNLALAATILREHHRPDEAWSLAVGRYHRPAGGAPAARYRSSVERHLARVLGTRLASMTLHGPAP